MKQSVFHFIPVAFRRHLGSLQYISARSGIFLHAGIFIHIPFKKESLISLRDRGGAAAAGSGSTPGQRNI